MGITSVWLRKDGPAWTLRSTVRPTLLLVPGVVVTSILQMKMMHYVSSLLWKWERFVSTTNPQHWQESSRPCSFCCFSVVIVILIIIVIVLTAIVITILPTKMLKQTIHQCVDATSNRLANSFANLAGSVGRSTGQPCSCTRCRGERVFNQCRRRSILLLLLLPLGRTVAVMVNLLRCRGLPGLGGDEQRAFRLLIWFYL